MQKKESALDKTEKLTDQIKTPVAQQFTIQPDFLSNLLAQYARKDRIDKNYGEEYEDQAEDYEFLKKVLDISEKSQQLMKNQEIIEDSNIINEEQCQKIHNIAIKHSNANRFNQSTDDEEISAQKMCPCGCRRTEGNPLPFCENQTEQYFFGPGIILYFFIIRKMLILVIVCALVYGIFSLATNIVTSKQITNECDDNIGTLGFLCQFKIISSTKNKLDKDIFLQIQLWLGFIICVIWIIGIRVVRSLGRLLNRKIDSELDSSSDYCIEISHLPEGQYSEQEILKYISILWKKYKGKKTVPKIKSVQIIYDISSIREKLATIVSSANKIVRMLQCFACKEKIKRSHKASRNSSFLNIIKKSDKQDQEHDQTEEDLTVKKPDYFQEVNDIEQGDQFLRMWRVKQQCREEYQMEKTNLLRMFKELEEKRQNFIDDPKERKKMATDIAFVEFSDSEQQTQFLKQIRQYRTTLLGDFKDLILEKFFLNQQQSNLFKGRPTKITRAPQPSDIHWRNCEKKFSYRRVGIVWLITFGIVASSFGVLMLIRFLRTNYPALNDFSILVSFSIQIFNRVIWNVLCFCIEIQENNTKTDNILSIMQKSMFAQTINITVLPIIMNVVLKDNIYGPEGLIGISLDYQFLVFLMMFNFNIFNLPYQIKKIGLCVPFIRNYIIRSKAKVVGEIDTIEEIADVLKYYEGPQFPIASGYIYMTAVIYHGMFFAHLQPTLIFYLIFNIFCFYWVNKYLLLRRCKISELLDFIIFQTSCSLLQHAALLYGIGSLLFVYLLQDNPEASFYIPSSLCILIWLIHMINPKKVMHLIVRSIVQLIQGNEEEKQISFNTAKDQKQLMNSIIKRSFFEKNMTKRRECYYKNSGTNDLLNFEARLIEIKQDNSVVNVNKRFCERFQVNMGSTTPFNEQSFMCVLNNSKKYYKFNNNEERQAKEKIGIESKASLIKIKQLGISLEKQEEEESSTGIKKNQQNP